MSPADERRDLPGLLRTVSPKIVALIYSGGTVAHLFRLAVGFTWKDMPFFVDWILVLLGPIGVVGARVKLDVQPEDRAGDTDGGKDGRA
jgi:hypothetical protein